MNNLNSKNKNSRKLNQGFTLLEALVAISILMVAVAAPITIAQKGLSSAVYSKDQMIASYLAQDAIEYIKNQRDRVSITHYSDWTELWNSDTAGNLSTCLTSAGCRIDTITGISTSDGTPAPLLKDTDNNFYGYKNGNPPTKFYRNVKITFDTSVPHLNTPGEYDKALVEVRVSWDQGEVVVDTIIFNY